jgi:hypothetical protein
MLQTTQPHVEDAEVDAEVEFTDLQLFPAEPAQVTELLVEEIQLPYDLIGAEPEAIMIRVAERFGLPQRLLVAPGDRMATASTASWTTRAGCRSPARPA